MIKLPNVSDENNSLFLVQVSVVCRPGAQKARTNQECWRPIYLKCVQHSKSWYSIQTWTRCLLLHLKACWAVNILWGSQALHTTKECENSSPLSLNTKRVLLLLPELQLVSWINLNHSQRGQQWQEGSGSLEATSQHHHQFNHSGHWGWDPPADFKYTLSIPCSGFCEGRGTLVNAALFKYSTEAESLCILLGNKIVSYLAGCLISSVSEGFAQFVSVTSPMTV